MAETKREPITLPPPGGPNVICRTASPLPCPRTAAEFRRQGDVPPLRFALLVFASVVALVVGALLWAS